MNTTAQELSFKLPYPTLTSFSFCSTERSRWRIGWQIIHPRKHQRDQNSIAIILEYHSVNNVKKLWRTNSGCNTHKCCPITITVYNFSCFFSRLFWNITCLDLECKQCTPELDINSTMANCLNYAIHSKALLYVSGRVDTSE